MIQLDKERMEILGCALECVVQHYKQLYGENSPRTHDARRLSALWDQFRRYPEHEHVIMSVALFDDLIGRGNARPMTCVRCRHAFSAPSAKGECPKCGLQFELMEKPV